VSTADRVPAVSVDEVVELFETWGPHRYDEQVSQLDHALQTAAHAVAERAPDALVAAALLHDVGHLLELADGAADPARTPDRAGDPAPTVDDLRHEGRGARWLTGLFPAGVTGPIALHVAAKRYRCAVDPAYHRTLSAGSTASLVRQGGPMSAAEQARFEGHPGHRDAVRLRGWDDAGKDTGAVTVPDLTAHLPLLTRLLATR
jgi:gamma-butyrobetaine dioxygenase